MQERKPDSPGSATTLKREHEPPELPDKLPSRGLQAPIRKNFAELLGPADRQSGVCGRPLNLALDLERPVRQFSILGLRQKGIEAAAVIYRPERRG